MNPKSVVKRALKDPSFARRLRSQARKAAKAGYRSAEFDVLLSNFAKTPKELAAIKQIKHIKAGFLSSWTWEPSL